MTLAGGGVEVLVEAVVARELDDRGADALGIGVESVAAQAMHEQPVDLDPDWAAPVAVWREIGRMPAVAWHRVARLGEAIERGRVEQRIQALRTLRAGDTGEQWREAGRDIGVG